MNLDRVTITGADNSTTPESLALLTEKYPFVEWGILVSSSYRDAGGSRFPSHDWIRRLQRITAGMEISLSLHVCGHWVRELLMGNSYIPEFMLSGFQRIQLNFHAERTPCDPRLCYNALLSLGAPQFIFQIDGATGNAHLESVTAEYDGDGRAIDAVPLFDISGGAGILPTEWPKPQYMNNDVDHCYHGYAGGLGPENLAAQLPLIGEAAGNTRIWIDMETRVRSADDKKFDLAKVSRCLDIASPFVKAVSSVS